MIIMMFMIMRMQHDDDDDDIIMMMIQIQKYRTIQNNGTILLLKSVSKIFLSTIF